MSYNIILTPENNIIIFKEDRYSYIINKLLDMNKRFTTRVVFKNDGELHYYEIEVFDER